MTIPYFTLLGWNELLEHSTFVSTEVLKHEILDAVWSSGQKVILLSITSRLNFKNETNNLYSSWTRCSGYWVVECSSNTNEQRQTAVAKCWPIESLWSVSKDSKRRRQSTECIRMTYLEISLSESNLDRQVGLCTGSNCPPCDLNSSPNISFNSFWGNYLGHGACQACRDYKWFSSVK
jgi:hypothetical protein